MAIGDIHGNLAALEATGALIQSYTGTGTTPSWMTTDGRWLQSSHDTVTRS
jgi:hypothetical protein